MPLNPLVFQKSQNFKDSLGAMMRTLRSSFPITPELEQKFIECLKKRNWLAHHYFKDRVHLFLTEAGRDEMISELSTAHQLFSDAEQKLDLLCRPIRLSNGITDERLETAYSEYMAELKARGSDKA